MADLPRIAQLTEQLIDALGIPPELLSESVKGTPQRVARAWAEMIEGYSQNPAELLADLFEVAPSGANAELLTQNVGQYGKPASLVTVRPITFSSTCEHHMLPFFGVAKIAYIPAVRDRQRVVVGLSKLIRLVNIFARRLSMQERIAEEVSCALMEHARAEGAMVLLRCRHTCVCGRGVRQVSAEAATLFAIGALSPNAPMHVTAVKMLDPTPRAAV